ncbi:FAD-dependent oxidoreductase [Albidovulum sp.]|uniref:FAD-dependent oxidoreductase n=1 Tax=Albidovulum sp. TaxID=1872424 RepID=UPI0039B98EB0
MAKRVVVVGASGLGCQMALAAKAAGHQVTLVDEHPQSLKAMSFDAPYFYGSGLPAALADEAAAMDNVLGSNEALMECVEADVDLRIGTVAWGAFQDSPNRQHIGPANVALVSAEGNELLDYDALILATGSRDFVPSFKGWDLPGVMGGKAGEKLLQAYQVFNGARVLVLGTGPVAMDFARAARARGVEVVAMIDPGDAFQGSDDDEAWLKAEAIPVHLRQVLLSAQGTDGVTSARLVSTVDGATLDVACDTICVAITTLPNVELPSAMGCEMIFAEDLAAWVPEVSGCLETTVPGVFWLSSFTACADPVDRIMSALEGRPASPLTAGAGATNGADARRWVAELTRTGGMDVVLCQCETVTRGEFLGVEPPRYLKSNLRQEKSHLSTSPDGPRVNQDQAKRMTRVGMGHCQGKRCRDEAALLLADRFGIALKDIKPASYRFPVRPIDMPLITAPEGDRYTPGPWQHWPEPKVEAEG